MREIDRIEVRSRVVGWALCDTNDHKVCVLKLKLLGGLRVAVLCIYRGVFYILVWTSRQGLSTTDSSMGTPFYNSFRNGKR